MTLYNITGLQNATSMPGVIKGVNAATNGYFGPFLFALIYLLLFLLVPPERLENSIIGVSFLMSIISGIMLGLEIIAWWVVAMNITLLVGSVLYKILNQN